MSLVLLEQHTAAGSATLDFTSFLSALYDEYLIELLGILPATNNVELLMRMSTDGGATFDATAAYHCDQFVWRAGGSAVGGSAAAATAITLSYTPADQISNASAPSAVHGSLRLFTPASATLYKTVLGSIAYLDSAGPFRVGNEIRGAYESLTPVNALRFLASAGNLSTGTIRIFGFGA